MSPDPKGRLTDYSVLKVAFCLENHLTSPSLLAATKRQKNRKAKMLGSAHFVVNVHVVEFSPENVSSNTQSAELESHGMALC